MIMKDVVISITGVQQGPNGPNAIELVTQGQYGVERDKIHLNLQHWQRHFDFDLHGRMADISYSLEDQDTRLVITIDGKTYDINLLADLAPQIDAIFA